jgi:hypothetical protein
MLYKTPLMYVLKVTDNILVYLVFILPTKYTIVITYKH